MILDAETDSIAPELRADVAIVGAGPAGISLALALSGRGLDVLVLEAGGPDMEERSDELVRMTTTGDTDYDASATRVSALGGTSNVWGGHSHPLEPQDFAARDWVARSGWPFGAEELAPWYPGAQELVEIGPEPFDLEHWRPMLEAEGMPVLETDRLRTGLFRLSPPTVFGERYRAQLEQSPDVTVWLHARVVHIATTPDGSAVSSLDVVTLDGDRSTVTADTYVLGTGGLEVPRLMLASNDVDPAGVGNRHDLVGRYFMEHPHFEAATAVLTEQAEARYSLEHLLYALGGTVGDSSPILAHVMLRPDVVADEELLPVALTVLLLTEDAEEIPHVEAVTELLRDIDGGDAGVRRLFLRGEQTPSPENRVTLGDEVDGRGMPVANLHWEVDADDRHRYARAIEIIGDELGAIGIGRVRSNIGDVDAFPPIIGGHHHMGTARMHEDPTRGVVDPDGRVHGMHNLYVASSAVFPTSGVANPTLTIVALALRLAEHLAGARG